MHVQTDVAAGYPRLAGLIARPQRLVSWFESEEDGQVGGAALLIHWTMNVAIDAVTETAFESCRLALIEVFPERGAVLLAANLSDLLMIEAEKCEATVAMIETGVAEGSVAAVFCPFATEDRQRGASYRARAHQLRRRLCSAPAVVASDALTAKARSPRRARARRTRSSSRGRPGRRSDDSEPVAAAAETRP